MYTKELLFLRESVIRNKDQLNSAGTNGSFCGTWEHEVPICSSWEHEVPIYLGEKEQLVPICSTWEHETPIYLGKKEQLVPFVVFGNTKFLFI